jgi:alpha-L-glutamate ligase-like protein
MVGLTNLISSISQLKQQGVLGINQRNLDYILKYNKRRYYPLVDNKVNTKKLAQQANIATPELYGLVRYEQQISQSLALTKQPRGCVIKPAQGAGGEGIMIIKGQRNGRYYQANGQLLTDADVTSHISHILSGVYSLGGHPDQAMLEYRVQFDPLFAAISYQGVPDIRIVCFLGYPVMAMVRLPTRQANGKANLHQGAIGVGVDIATGETLDGVWFNEVILEHPDTGNEVRGLTIPHWTQVLLTAARCYELTQLGYLGVDIVLDKELGPLMLELNARPGLNIQIANKAGLTNRYKLAEADAAEQRTAQQRVAFCQTHFAVN